MTGRREAEPWPAILAPLPGILYIGLFFRVAIFLAVGATVYAVRWAGARAGRTLARRFTTWRLPAILAPFPALFVLLGSGIAFLSDSLHGAAIVLLCVLACAFLGGVFRGLDGRRKIHATLDAMARREHGRGAPQTEPGLEGPK